MHLDSPGPARGEGKALRTSPSLPLPSHDLSIALLTELLAPWGPHSCPRAFVPGLLSPTCCRAGFFLFSTVQLKSHLLFQAPLIALSDVAMPLPSTPIHCPVFSLWYLSVSKGVYFIPSLLSVAPTTPLKSPSFTSEFQQLAQAWHTVGRQ